MKISIITVSYNSAISIESTIQSILSQKYSLIEYIIIDGGSIDGTVDIIRSYADRISYWVSERDHGIYDAMNKGIQLATGDIIGLLNSDDVYENENTISNIVMAFKQNNCDAVFGDLVYINADNKVTRYWKSSPYCKGAFLKGWHPPHPSLFLKRTVYEKYGEFNLNYEVSADFEFMLRLFEIHNIKSFYINDIIVRMRIGGESNRSIKNIVIGNKNIRKAFLENKLSYNLVYPIRRFGAKIVQFFK